MRKLFASLYLLYGAIIFISLMLVVCPLVIVTTLIFKGKTAKRIALFFLYLWAMIFSFLSFFWLRTVNKRNVDTSRPYIYTGNHGSYLDAVAVAYAMPQVFSPLGKIEMAKIPVFGLIYERVVVLIDRSSKESRLLSVNSLKEEIKKGISILIFPEGTMNQTNEVLAPFFDGAFRIAIETQTPILPFVLLNNRKLLPRKEPLALRPGMITVIFGEPVEVTGLIETDVEELKNKVHLIMRNLMLRKKH